MRDKRRFGWLCRSLPLLALALLLTLGSLPTPAAAVTQADIDALKSDAKDIAQEKKDIQAQIDKLSTDISTTMERKRLLDSQIGLTEGEIANKEEEIAVYADLIVQTEAELADAEAREAAQYELFCKRVRAMEEQGKVEYWSVLFRADSFSDLLGRLDIINEIMEYDQRVISNLKELQALTAGKKAELEGQKAASEAAKAELEGKKRDLAAQRDAANALVAKLRQQQQAQEDALDDLSDEEEAVQSRIKELTRKMAEEEAARRAAAGQSAPASNPGGYIWPVSSHYITSTVGGRASPGGIGSTNHKGTDIGRVGYDSTIYAAKAGTVLISEYSKSYGNYVVLYHGSGNTTLYAHMSSRKVSVGQSVRQGDVLGITGSTGNSTGPHLHFEIKENDAIVDPLAKGYLTGYTLSGSA
ncbi:murein hydrolase activator EnvC [uncultured Oscillibacter sp.]|uniref:murein hydrolase activator EnvC family protein n=1 Tax=uncultured Oscillibacter sp. TaxID=876091 RepID=UPI0025E0B56F|nr:M23 family metallopeptidase [uncultured Oscillibacter sp.]